MKNEVYLRPPSGRTIECPLDERFQSLEYTSKSNTLGQWFVYQGRKSRRLLAIHNKSRADKVGSSLVFESSLEDTGEEFLILLYSGGFKIVRLSLSPVKCPVERYHGYVDEFTQIIDHPTTGSKSVAGKSGDDGRPPTNDELTFRLIERVAAILKKVAHVRDDIPKHERGMGGTAGIDPIRTLKAWKSNPSWYRTAQSEDSLTLKVGNHDIIPLRTVPRPSRGKNKFIGAVKSAITNLLSNIPPTASGGTIAYVLTEVKRKATKIDKPAVLRSGQAWKYLRRRSFPARSQAVANSLLDIREGLLSRSLHDHVIGGRGPYFLYPPEIVFQWFAVAECLISLGAPASNIRTLLNSATDESGCTFGDFQVWIDTDKHDIQGWRDDTAAPSKYKPDLFMKNLSTCEVLMVDAKFRRSNQTDRIMSSSSIKDIQAYMNEYGLEKSVIITPFLDGDPNYEDIKSNGKWIRGVPLSNDSSHHSRSHLKTVLSPLWN